MPAAGLIRVCPWPLVPVTSRIATLSGASQNRGAPLADLTVALVQRAGHLVETGDDLAQGLSILLTSVVLRDLSRSLRNRTDLSQVPRGDHHLVGTRVSRSAPVSTCLARGGASTFRLTMWVRDPRNTVPFHGSGA